MILARDDSNAFVFLACVIIFVMCFSIVVVIFLPKMKYLQMTDTTSSSTLGRTDSSSKPFSAFLGAILEEVDATLKNSNDDSKSQASGLQVYGTQTKEELLIEVQSLMSNVKNLEREVDRLNHGKKLDVFTPAGDDINVSEVTMDV